MDPAARIADFVRRQYVDDEGDVRHNVAEVFDRAVIYHAGDEVLGRRDLVAMGHRVRAIARERRRIEATDFITQGLTVRWHLTSQFLDADAGGEPSVQRSHVVARLGCDGRIVEVWSTPVE